MITTLKASNFQSLVDVTIHPGRVTVILGPNDFGKSALLRALRFAAEARSGVDFITYGATHAQVVIEAENHTLTWQKGSKVNRYLLDDEKFEKVGRQVPPEVAAFLGLAPIDYDSNLQLNVNFADQDDPPFLIPTPGGLTASGVAKVLGDLTNLNILFKALHEADKRKRGALEIVRLRETDTANLDLQLRQFDDLDAQVDRQEDLEQQLAGLKKREDNLQTLRQLREKKEDLRNVHTQLQRARSATGYIASGELGAAKAAAERVVDLCSAQSKLSELEARWRQSAVDRADATIQLDAAREIVEQIRLDAQQVEICPTCKRPL